MDGYYAFMLVATAFVLMMTVPALALFYGGMSRSKSVLNMMMMSYVAAAIVGILYVAVGWSMGFGGDGTLFANPFELLWLDGVTTDAYIGVMFQMTFAIITAALISGAVADRLKFSAWVVFVPLWALSSSTSRWRTWSSAAPRTRSSAAGSAPRTTPAAPPCTSTPASRRSCSSCCSASASAGPASRCARTT